MEKGSFSYQAALVTGGLASTPLVVRSVFTVAKAFPSMLGAVIFLSLLVTSLVTPAYSSFIDRVSRRRVLAGLTLAESVVFACAFFLYPLLGRPLLIYLTLVGGVELVSNLYWTAANSLLRDVVTRENYRSQAGYAEISSQLPAVVAAGSAVFLSTLPFGSLLVFGVALDLVSAVMLSGVPEHRPDHFNGSGGTTMQGVERTWNHWSSVGIREFFRYVRAHLAQVALVYLIGFPFVFTVAGNFVKPVFIANILHGSPAFLAFSEAEYAGFAIVAGLVTPLLQRRLGDSSTLILLFSAYTVASFIMPMYASYTVFTVCQAIHGLGNPGSRVVRKSVVLKSVDRGELGRFNGSVSLLFTLTRMVIIGGSTIMISVGVQRVMVAFSVVQATLTALFLVALFRAPTVKRIFLSEAHWAD